MRGISDCGLRIGMSAPDGRLLSIAFVAAGAGLRRVAERLAGLVVVVGVDGGGDFRFVFL